MNNLELLLTDLDQTGYLTEMDIGFADFLIKLTSDSNHALKLGAALVSRASREGDICLDLTSLAQISAFSIDGGLNPKLLPDPESWFKKLAASPAVGRPGSKLPLILDQKKRLYLYRYWEYEHLLSESIGKRIIINHNNIEYPLLRDGIQRHFSDTRPEEIDWQKIASIMAVLKNLSIISGGPGTGKTYTVAKILALFLEQAHFNGLNHFQIYLAAPTGKAASKLGESIQRAKNDLNCNSHIKNMFPKEASTIHRMLKILPRRPYFFYNRQNRLPADAVVIDEASMVDLPLMSKLFQAIPDHSRLILIGDRDQLASVEAGSILGDICPHEKLNHFSRGFCNTIHELSGEKIQKSIKLVKNTGLQDCMINLVKNYRFHAGGEIGDLSRAVNLGHASATLDLLDQKGHGKIHRTSVISPNNLSTLLEEQVISGYSRYLKAESPAEALKRFNHFIILCALKKGPFGVESINKTAEQILSREGLIHPDPVKPKSWYRGKPVLIKTNNYHMGLFNGDIGITMPGSKKQPDDLFVFFKGPNREIRRFSPYQLPEHETVFAMTVHKSQGSEFDHVILILPGKAYPLLTRELLYTAITRTRKSIEVFGGKEIIREAVSRKIERTSGLSDALNMDP